MSRQDWLDLASVYDAGAKRSRQWSYNIERQQQAEVLDAMAERCREIAASRSAS
jgi:hypothetical protein